MRKNTGINIFLLIIVVIVLFSASIYAVKRTSPQIIFTYPTPADRSVQAMDAVFVNTSLEEADTAFIDWDNSLIGWWKFDNQTDIKDYSSYDHYSVHLDERGGAWCWFADPRAVHYNGVTFVGWGNYRGDAMIWSYNHSRGETKEFNLHPEFEVDDHANPLIFIRPDGHLMVFYSRHAGIDNISYRVSTNPSDISAWEPEETTGLSGGNTAYPNPVYLSDEDLLYLFYRGPNELGWDPTFTIYNGTDWSPDTKFIEYASSELQRPYVKVASNNKDKIHFAFNPGNPNKHHNNSLYYFYYRNGSFYLPDDTYITNFSGLPLTLSNVSLVYDFYETHEKSWIGDIAFDESEEPIIVHIIVEDPNDHYYLYSWFNKSSNSWVNNYITYSGKFMSGDVDQRSYSGGITIDPENTSIVYLSKRMPHPITGYFNIQKATTNDKGKTWTFENLTENYSHHNLRPFVVRNHTDDFNIIWFSGYYHTFNIFFTKVYSDKMIVNDFGINTTTGKFGNSMDFDGAYDILAVADDDVLDGMSELTVEAWIKKPSCFEELHSIVSKWVVPSPGSYTLSYACAPNWLNWWVGNDADEYAYSRNIVSIEDNEWHHVVGVYNGTHVYTYLDGSRLPNVNPFSGNIKSTLKPLVIGADPNGIENFRNFFEGNIDEVKIFSRALSEQEILASYDAGTYRLYRDFTGLPISSYIFKVYAQDFDGNIASAERRVRVEVDIFYDEFDGETTDLSDPEIDLSAIENFVLEKIDYGKIEFNEFVDLSEGADLNNDVEISDAYISIDSPALDKPATLTVYNLNFRRPVILKNRRPCTYYECTSRSYSGGTLKFDIEEAAEYSIVEKDKKPKKATPIYPPR